MRVGEREGGGGEGGGLRCSFSIRRADTEKPGHQTPHDGELKSAGYHQVMDSMR